MVGTLVTDSELTEIQVHSGRICAYGIEVINGVLGTGGYSAPWKSPCFLIHNFRMYSFNKYTQQQSEFPHWFAEPWTKGFYGSKAKWKPLELFLVMKIVY